MPPAKPLSVIIVGGGIGGLSLALCLAKSGHRVTVLESAPKFEEIEVGAGVRLTPNCARLLLKWGFEDDLRRLGTQPDVVQLFRCGCTWITVILNSILLLTIPV